MTSPSERPIASVQELVNHFERGCKRPDALRIGLEHEKIGVLSDGRPPDYQRIGKLLEAISTSGWGRVEEHGNLIALSRQKCGSITLEPGGQVEHSGAPWHSPSEAIEDNRKHLDELLPLARDLGIRFLAVGFRPFGTLDEVPWMPKGRYAIMRAYLPEKGVMAHEMMKRTATVQANLDYVSEEDAMEKLRVGMGLSSLVTALFAASPIVDGKLVGYQSYRARAWLETDPDRCGLLRFAFDPDARFIDYVEWALDVPMFFLYRDGEYRPLKGITFRRFLEEGIDEQRALPSDWEIHLSTLFPEVRLKTYVEVRQADSSSREMVRALPALWQGILYDDEARRAAWQLVSEWSWQERLDLYHRTPREGLRAKVGSTTLGRLSQEMVALARRGLERQGSQNSVAYLAPLERIGAEGRSVADRIEDAYRAANGEPPRLIEAIQLH